MINFVYTAKRIDTGEIVKAEVQAENASAAAKLLQSQSLFPISIQNKEDGGFLKGVQFGTGVKAKDRVLFTRQLATLINAGLPLLQSLRTVQGQVANKKLQEVLKTLVASVEGGSTLSSAFAQHPRIFNQVYVSLVAAGETSGTLDKTLDRLATQQEKDAAIVSKIRGAMIYPIIVLGVILAVLAFMLTTVLPQIGLLYKDLKRELPFITRMLLAISGGIIRFWWLALILGGGAGYGLRNLAQTDKGRRVADSLKLNVPIFGRLFRKVYMARYCRTLSTLLASGIPLLEALNVVKNAVNNSLLAHSIERSMSQVKGGKALSATIEDDPNFLSLVPQMIRIGEQSGAIDDMLARVATFYENEVDDEVKNLSTTIEPLLMVVLGVTVGLVVAAILLPVYALVGQGVQ